MENQQLFKLKHPTVFPELNKNLGKDIFHLTSELILFSLKYKHLRYMAAIKPEEQVNYAIKIMTNLSDNDVGELTPQDAAALTKIIYESLKEFTNLGRVFWENSLSKQIIDSIFEQESS